MIKNIYRNFAKERSLTKENIGSLVFYLAIPAIVSNLLQTIFNLVDVFWVGRLGPSAIAAVSMSGTILMIIMFFMVGIATGTTALVARHIGAEDQRNADNTAMQSIVLGIVVSIPLSIMGYILSPMILKILGASSDVILLGTGYMRITFVWTFAIFLMFLISAILQGAGDTFTPMLVLILSNVINIVLDPFMIFGIGIFPKMGVDGAAWATVISRVIGLLIALEILLKGRSRIHVKLKEYKNDFVTMWKIIKIGVPTSAQMSLRGFMSLFLMSFVAFFGTTAIAAYGIGVRMEMIFIMPGFGFAAAAQTLVGQNLGAKNYDRAVKSAWVALFYYLIMGIIVTIVFFFFSESVMKFFSSDQNVIDIGSKYLRITSISYIFTAISLVLNRSLVGAGDTISPMIITFVGLWGVMVPLAYYLSKNTGLGLTGIWIAIVIAVIIQAFLNYSWFQIGRWKYKKL